MEVYSKILAATLLGIIWSPSTVSQLLGSGVVAIDNVPSFLVEPPSVVVWNVGASALRIPCVVRSGNATWLTADGGPVDMQLGRRYVQSDGTLVIEDSSRQRSNYNRHGKLESSQDGKFSTAYRCKASNHLGAIVSREVHIEDAMTKRTEGNVRQIDSSILGNPAVLDCILRTPFSSKKSISWYRDGRPIFANLDGGDQDAVYSKFGQFLIFPRLTERDLESSYTCALPETSAPIFDHPTKITQSYFSVHLERFPPRLASDRFSIVEVEESDDAVLLCYIHGGPAPSYTWNKAHSNVSETTRINVRRNVVIIRNSRISDSDIWLCTAKNRFGELIVEITLRVSPRFKLTIQPETAIVSTNKPIKFNCSAQGSVDKEVKWFHNGALITIMDYFKSIQILGGNILTIDQVKGSDVGFYQCSVYRHGYSYEANARLILLDTPPQFKMTFHPRVLKSGQHVMLQCKALADPTPQISWKLDGQPLTASQLQRYHFKQYSETSNIATGQLNLTNVQLEDGGYYECNATNSGGSVTHGGRIDVYGPPYIRYIAPLHSVAGSNITVHCPYSGYPISSVSWEKKGSTNNNRLKSRDFVGIDFPNVLQITDLQLDDAGTYVCSVVGTSGELARRDIQLHVHNPPVIVPFSFPTNVFEGGSAQATCTVSSGDRPIYFSWYKDGVQIPLDLKVEHRNMGFFSLLIFEKVMTNHNGSYTCAASNNAAGTNFTADLIVKVPPQWITEPQNTSAVSGNSLTIPCTAQGYPKPEVIWTVSKDSSLFDAISPAMSEKMSLLEDGSLRITSITSLEEGWYRCSIDNKVGKALSKAVFISVNEPPQISTTSNNITLRHGDTAYLTCEAVGDVPLAVAWYRGSQRIRNDYKRLVISEVILDNRISSKVTIKDATSLDDGLYKCQVENQYGRGETIIRVSVQERPKPPLNLQVVEVSSRSMQLSWQQGHDGGSPVQSYLLQYRLTAGTHEEATSSWRSEESTNVTILHHEVIRDKISSSNLEQVTLSGLKPATVYLLRMLAVNQIDSSIFSDGIMAKTKDEAPSEAPKSLEISAKKPRELQIFWKAPPRTSWNGILSGYLIYWREDIAVSADLKDKYAEKSVQIKGNAVNNFTVNNLGNYKQYLVSVAAYNNAGIGPRTATVIATTLEGLPEEEPHNLSCVALSPVSLKLWWSPLMQRHAGGALQGYKVTYIPIPINNNDGFIEHSDIAVETKRSILPEVNLNTLKKYTRYSIRVRAYTRSGDGPSTHPVTCSTHEDVPDAPKSIKAASLSRTSVVISWLHPSSPNGIVLHYTLYMREISPQKYDTSVKTVSTKLLSNSSDTGILYQMVTIKQYQHTVGGLREGTSYEFWMSANTKIGEGASTYPLIQQPSSAGTAKITSFGGTIKVNYGNSAILQCSVCGSPQPRRQWYKDSIPLLTTTRIMVNAQGHLIISNVISKDAGTYTCAAHNEVGSDHIKIVLSPIMPPPPPSLTLISAQRHTLRIATSGPASGIVVIHYRPLRPERPWKNITLPPGSKDCYLTHLECATVYQIYATAQQIRAALPVNAEKSMLTVKTAGGPPITPKDVLSFLTANDTTAMMETKIWAEQNVEEGDNCGQIKLKIEVRSRSDKSWSVITTNSPSAVVAIPHLSPATWYRLKITASNDAGTTVAMFNFATTTEDGISIAPPLDLDSYFDDELEPLTLVITCTAAVLFGLVIMIIAVITKRNISQCGGCRQGINMDTEKETKRELPHPAFLTLNGKETSTEKYNISPYATFSGAIEDPCVSPASYSPEYIISMGAFPQPNDGPPPIRHPQGRRKCHGRHLRTKSQGRNSASGRMPVYFCEQHQEETELSPTEAEQIAYHNELRYDIRNHKTCHHSDTDDEVQFHR